MAEWQPIETAPKDGTRFLGCNAFGVGIVHRHDPGGQYECWVGEQNYPALPKLTYWMPLPEPPSPQPDPEARE